MCYRGQLRLFKIKKPHFQSILILHQQKGPAAESVQFFEEEALKGQAVPPDVPEPNRGMMVHNGEIGRVLYCLEGKKSSPFNKGYIQYYIPCGIISLCTKNVSCLFTLRKSLLKGKDIILSSLLTNEEVQISIQCVQLSLLFIGYNS